MTRRQPMTARRESGYAGERKNVTMRELKFADLLTTGDALEFVYQSRKFTARVSRFGLIEAVRHPLHERTTEQTLDHSLYSMPSNFTNDCVRVYWDGAEACKTNPSGYDRVRHLPSGKTLNALRDDYMQRFVSGKRSPEAAAAAATAVKKESAAAAAAASSESDGGPRDPMAVAEAIDRRPRTSKRRRSSSNNSASSSVAATKRRRKSAATKAAAAAAAAPDSDEEDAEDDERPAAKKVRAAASAASMSASETGAAAAAVLNDRMSSVATVRASGRVPGYKGIADTLQTKLARQNRVLASLMGWVENFVTKQTGPDEASAMLRAFYDAPREAASEPVSPKRPVAQSSAAAAAANPSPLRRPAEQSSSVKSLLRDSLSYK